ncbi:MAG: tetraacyldisaccharide 4'-kinase, partial [Alphaproteobacteria bacterium]|nr:tetraacyldisaccharide 4'-kinase [Alphaproteobacteria bacterium]
MRAPEFWRRGGALPLALSPLGGLTALAGRLRRAWATPWRAPIPVIVVGNLVAGGAGKTPVALSLAARFRVQGTAVHMLTRGYGGRLAGPVRVDPARHDAREIGDEALLLAAQGPCWVARDRVVGARAAIADGARLLVLDDGFQNPSLAFDLSLVVVDGAYGFGNGRVMPAGPLREAVPAGLARADGVVLLGDDEVGVAAQIAELRPDLPVLRARLVPGPEGDGFAGRRVYAFAGIGRPEKFFRLLTQLRAEIVGRESFPDHHAYRPDEVMRIVEAAQARGAVPVTTAKDAVRL